MHVGLVGKLEKKKKGDFVRPETKIWESASSRERQKSNAVFYATLGSGRYPTYEENFLKIFRSSSTCDSQSHKQRHLLQHNQGFEWCRTSFIGCMSQVTKFSSSSKQIFFLLAHKIFLCYAIYKNKLARSYCRTAYLKQFFISI